LHEVVRDAARRQVELSDDNRPVGVSWVDLSAAAGLSVLVLVSLDDLGDRLSYVLTDGASPHRCPGLQAGVQFPWELHVEGDLVHGA
jgi:hypothetical protein